MRIRRELEKLREEDDLRAPSARLNRTISRAEFDQICRGIGHVASTEELLKYLHNVSAVYYQPHVFGGRVVLDQKWALDAVYSIFDRRRSYQPLKRLGGRFTFSLLRLIAPNSLASSFDWGM